MERYPDAHGRRVAGAHDAGRDRGRHPRGRRGRSEAGQGAAAGRRRGGAPRRHLREPRPLQRRGHRRRGRPHARTASAARTAGSRINDLQNYEQTVCTDTVELYHHDYSFKPIKPVLPFEQETMRQDAVAAHHPGGIRRDAGPGPLHRCPTVPCRTGRQLLPLGRIDEARAAQEEAVEAAVDDIVLRRRRHVRGRRRRHQPRHGRGGRRRRLPGRPQGDRAHPRRASRHWGIQIGMAERVRARACTASSSTTACGSPGSGRPRRCGSAAKAGASIFGPAVNVNTRQDGGLERGPHLHHRQAVHATPPRSPSTSTGAWAWAACPCTRCRPSTPSRAPRARASTSCGSTACRSAPATTTARGSAMVSRRAWADCGPPEIWWPACR